MFERAFSGLDQALHGRLPADRVDAVEGAATPFPWSIAIALHEPTTRVVAVELPEVLTQTRAAVEAAGVADRIELVAGDLFRISFRAEHDVVVAANLCHLFDAERAATLVARLAAALAPGGTLALVDLPGDGVDDPGPAIYGVGLALRTSGGGLHTDAEHRRWLAGAGLFDVAARPVTEGGLHLWTGRVPARTRTPVLA
jgi:SAM-dependent methyltransferase